MEFGVFDWIENRPIPLAQHYEERLKLLEEADRAGFFCYHLAEHHCEPLSTAPSPALFLAAAAQRTRRIHLGPLCYVLPLYNPLRLIEEVCMLDHLTGGRLELGVGRGANPVELHLYGIDPERSREMFDEALAVLVRGLTSERLTHEGRYWRYRDVPLELHPLQKPYPPLWYPTHNPESIAMAGIRGLNVVTAMPNRILRDLIRTYRENWAAHRGDPDRLNPQVESPRIAVNKLLFLAETDREAQEVARAAHAVWWSSLTWLSRAYNVDLPGIRAMGDYDRAAGSGGILIGSPATVGAEIEQLGETGINYVICAFQWGSITHAQAMTSMGLFAREIIPRFGAPASASG